MSKLVLFLTLFIHAFSSVAQDTAANPIDSVMVNPELSPMDAPPIVAKKWNQINNRYFTMHIGLAIILDHNITIQDDNNLTQVGKVGPETEFRAERFVLAGNLLFFRHPWRYMVSANYNGIDAPEGEKLDFLDWVLEVPFGKRGGWVTIGKQKEGVGHEYVSSGSQMMFMERGAGATAFVRQRNIGIRYSNSIFNNRVTYTWGLFNNYWESGKSFSDNGSQITFRVSAIPRFTSERSLTHVGLSFRYTDATDGKLSYKAKPEVNTAPSFIKTDSFPAASASTLMLELIQVKGPVSFLGEYMRTVVSSSDAGNPSFYYWQTGASWFLTGDNRRYNKQTGNLGKLIPKKNFSFKRGGGPGAIELAARYTKSNLVNGTINGGEFGRFTTALGWYPDAHFRFEINYGLGKLEKSELRGNADFWQFRAQFEL